MRTHIDTCAGPQSTVLRSPTHLPPSLRPGVAYSVGSGARVAFGDVEFVLELEAAGGDGGLEATLAAAFLASFRTGGSAEVKKLLEEQGQ